MSSTPWALRFFAWPRWPLFVLWSGSGCARFWVSLIAALAPLASAVDWSGIPALLKHYVAPDSFYFGFFPWAAFVAFGMSVGSLLRHLDRAQIGVAMQWLAGIGVAFAFGAWVLSNSAIVIYPNSDFWVNSPGLILIKLGVLLMLLSFSWLWNLGMPEGQWSWIRQFGVTSLLVYWVHVELVYGRWLWFFKESLTLPQTVAAAICVTILMLGVSLVRTNWATVRLWLRAVWSPASTPGGIGTGRSVGRLTCGIKSPNDRIRFPDP